MTVRENLLMGGYLRRDTDIEPDMDRCFDLFPVCRARATEGWHDVRRRAADARDWAGADGQAEAHAARRALDRHRPDPRHRIYETIPEINKQGTTILLVEQNANYALGVSMRGYVLETGKVALTDASDALRTNPDVQKAYLGA